MRRRVSVERKRMCWKVMLPWRYDSPRFHQSAVRMLNKWSKRCGREGNAAWKKVGGGVDTNSVYVAAKFGNHLSIIGKSSTKNMYIRRLTGSNVSHHLHSRDWLPRYLSKHNLKTSKLLLWRKPSISCSRTSQNYTIKRTTWTSNVAVSIEAGREPNGAVRWALLAKRP